MADLAPEPVAVPPVMDIQDRGIGDVVLAAWLAASARAAGLAMRVNVRGHEALARALGLTGSELSDATGPSWTRTDGLGLKREYAAIAGGDPRSRFALWADSLGLGALPAVRPAPCLPAEACEWAEGEWTEASADGRPGRAVLLPQAAWPVRQWPLAYFIDLADALEQRGYTVILMGSRKDAVARHGRRWYAGFELTRSAALLSGADLVVANDSGPAHLGGVLGVQTVALCGPTRGATVFAHDHNIHPIAVARSMLPCVGCHFDERAGYRRACRSGGCRALFLLTPEDVLARMDALDLGPEMPSELRMPALPRRERR
ncbi:MAG: glycosyltransferase family 9 protein [Azospirillaceae bacterium]